MLGAGVAFAFELSSLGPDLTNTSDSIGFMIGSFAGIGSVILPSVAGGKQEGKSETSTFLQGDMMKWALPLVLGIGSLGVFLGAPDAGSKFNQGFMRGLMDSVWSGLIIRVIMQTSSGAIGVITSATEGVGDGAKEFFSKRIKGEDSQEGEEGKKLIKAAKVLQKYAIQTKMDVAGHVGSVLQSFDNSLNAIYQSRGTAAHATP